MREPRVLDDVETNFMKLLARPDPRSFRAAPCRDLRTEAYFPEVGVPDAAALQRCYMCPVRIDCLAIALRAEEPDARYGWFGGLGPAEREDIAARLGLVTRTNAASPRGDLARRLKEEGMTIGAIATELNCSARTIQRDLRGAG